MIGGWVWKNCRVVGSPSMLLAPGWYIALSEILLFAKSMFPFYETDLTAQVICPCSLKNSN
jgi:hypothetical protein